MVFREVFSAENLKLKLFSNLMKVVSQFFFSKKKRIHGLKKSFLLTTYTKKSILNDHSYGRLHKTLYGRHYNVVIQTIYHSLIFIWKPTNLLLQ
jgi:hypothetical protein